MADVASTLPGWSATAASNQPQDATTIGTNLDDNLREIQAVVRGYLAGASQTIASAGTLDLATATSNYISVSGTTTITALGTVSEGMIYALTFQGALTFTHNGASLILPGSANITTVAGDVAVVRSLGSGNWKCLYYTRASGASIGGVTVANEASDTTCFPLFATAATGDLQPKTNANLTYNSSTGAFGITGIQTITANSASAGLAITQAGAGHALTVSSGDAICLDGSASGDTYISETATNGLGLTAGGIEAIRASPVGVSISNSAAQVVTAGLPIRLHTVLDGSVATSGGLFVDSNYTLTAAASTVRGITLNNDFETNSVNGTTSLISGGTVMGAYLQTAITGTVATSMTAAGGVFARVSNDSSTLAIGTVYGYNYLFQNNSTGSFTTQVGYYAPASVAATNAYGFQGALAAAANVWNLYMSGSANNALVGNLRIGSTTAPTVALDVTGSAIISGNTTLGDASGDILTINAGAIMIGHTAQYGVFGISTSVQQITGLTINAASTQQALFNQPGEGPRHTFITSRGATANSHTVVASGDLLGETRYAGSDGTGYIRAAAIGAYVDGTPGTNDMPGRLIFSTTADGGTTPAERFRIDSAGLGSFVGVLNVASGTATPAAGSTAARLLFGTTAGFGIYYGSGAPTVSAAQGSIYLRSDGSSTSTRLYVNTNGTTGWTNFTSAT